MQYNFFHVLTLEMYQVNRPKTSSAKLVFLVEVPRGLLQCSVIKVSNRPEVSTHIAAEVLGHVCYAKKNKNKNCRAVLETSYEKEYKFIHSER
jgi:hypothetical protein